MFKAVTIPASLFSVLIYIIILDILILLFLIFFEYSNISWKIERKEVNMPGIIFSFQLLRYFYGGTCYNTKLYKQIVLIFMDKPI